jgi:hypothetical protein
MLGNEQRDHHEKGKIALVMRGPAVPTVRCGWDENLTSEVVKRESGVMAIDSCCITGDRPPRYRAGSF